MKTKFNEFNEGLSKEELQIVDDIDNQPKSFEVLDKTIDVKTDRELYWKVFRELKKRMDDRLDDIDPDIFPDDLFKDHTNEDETEEEKELTKRLNNLDPDIFPDDLYTRRK